MLCLTALLGLFLTLVPVPENAPDDDQARLQGRWEIVSWVEKGMAVPERQARTVEVIVQKDQFTWRVEGEDFRQYRFRLNPRQSPREVDFTGLSEDEQGKRLPGIYRLEDDVLRVAVNLDDVVRPRSFEPKDAAGYTLLVLRRRAK